jgi:hypothetical protein
VGSSPVGKTDRPDKPTSSLLVSMTVDTLTHCIDHRQYEAMKLIQVISEECCPEVLMAPLGAEEAEEVAAALRIVADPARLRLLSLISTTEGGRRVSATSPSR